MHDGRAEHVFQHCRSLCRLASNCTVYRASTRRQRCAKRQHSTSTRRRNVSRRTRATTQTVRPMQKKPRRNRRQVKYSDRNRMCIQAQEQLILSENEDRTTCFSIKIAKTKCACMSFGGSYSAKDVCFSKLQAGSDAAADQSRSRLSPNPALRSLTAILRFAV